MTARRRRRWLGGAVLALASLVAFDLCVYHVHLREELVIGLYGSDPRVLVWEGLGHTSIAIWGRLRYDDETKCLYLETSSSKERPEVLDRPVAVIWPKGSRPVMQDGRAGVRVGGFLGRLGGTIFFDGDLLVGVGGGVGYVRQMTPKPGELCYRGTLRVSFGEVERVDELPDWEEFDPAGPTPLYLETPIGDPRHPVVRRWL